MNRYVIADTHFNHANIIGYCNRPFKTVEEMNSKLISNWNNTVAKDDIIWVLGDFALGSKEYIITIGNSLNGRKRMVLGNHDRHNKSVFEQAGFEFISPYPVLIDKFIILSHAPIQNPKAKSQFYNIYGHVHNDAAYLDIGASGRCVSVERIGYRPIDLDKIIKEISK